MTTTLTRRRAAPVASTRPKKRRRPAARTKIRAATSPRAGIFAALTIGLLLAASFYRPNMLPESAPPTPQETVSILGRNYPVPAPWKGHFIGDEAAMRLADPAPIPERWSDGGASIFLNKDARNAFVAMAEAAAKDGVEIKAVSGYRSFDFQRRILEARLNKGQDFDAIVRWTAPPGYSRHMLGTVVDLSPNNESFVRSPGYQWLRGNAGRFGFEETYSPQSTDGFPPEPWHWEWAAVR